MPEVRIMPCLDIKDGRIVKGVNFVSLQDAGDPVQSAQAYEQDGADELAFLDITATVEKRRTTLDVLQQVARTVDIPLTVGGGISSVSDAQRVLLAGADRVSVSSAAFRNPELIDDLARTLGSDRLVVAIDVDRSDVTASGYEGYIDGGRSATGVDALAWAQEAARRGAGMILPTSKACDGLKQGYDIPLIRLLKKNLSVPVVASGGAGALQHFLEAAQAGADILLAASVFHFGQIRISELKRYLEEHGIQVAGRP